MRGAYVYLNNIFFFEQYLSTHIICIQKRTYAFRFETALLKETQHSHEMFTDRTQILTIPVYLIIPL